VVGDIAKPFTETLGKVPGTRLALAQDRHDLHPERMRERLVRRTLAVPSGIPKSFSRTPVARFSTASTRSSIVLATFSSDRGTAGLVVDEVEDGAFIDGS